MKKLCVLCILILLLSNSCKDNKTSIKENNETKEIATSKNYVPFGKEINEENAITAKEMERKYSGMKEGDTLDVKFCFQC